MNMAFPSIYGQQLCVVFCVEVLNIFLWAFPRYLVFFNILLNCNSPQILQTSEAALITGPREFLKHPFQVQPHSSEMSSLLFLPTRISIIFEIQKKKNPSFAWNRLRPLQSWSNAALPSISGSYDLIAYLLINDPVLLGLFLGVNC